MKHLFAIFVLGLALVLTQGGNAYAAPNATFTVNQTADLVDANLADNRCDTNLSTAGDQCSLRAAIQQANATAGTDTLTFVSSAAHTLTRFGIDNTASAGDLDITESVIIRGRAPNTTIDANGAERVFQVFGSSAVTFENLILRGGRFTTNNVFSTGVEGSLGDLIFNSVTLTDNIVSFVEPPGLSGPCCNGVADILCQCAVTFTNSQATSGGSARGIVANRVTMTESVVRNHGRFGLVVSSGNSVITRSVISNNMGGIANNGGNVLIRDSEISESTGGANLFEVFYVGRGVFNSGVMNIVNSTISGNKTIDSGGGILNSGTMGLFNVTIANNSVIPLCDLIGGQVLCTSGNGGGISNLGTLTMANTIVADNQDNASDDGVAPDCSGILVSGGFSLIENTDGCTLNGDATGNKLNVESGIGTLKSNGGPTRTHAFRAASPAIDAGNLLGCLDHNNNLLTTDQRGFPRPTDGNGIGDAQCDIGAFEAGAVGIGEISPNKGSSQPGALQLFDVAWDSPTRWRDLQTVDLRFKRGKETLLWLRFTEGLPHSTFSILDKNGNVLDSGDAGDAKILKNKFGALDLSQSGFTASGPDDPHVVLHYAVKFKKPAAGKLKLQMLATDDFANEQGPEPGGKWKVKQ